MCDQHWMNGRMPGMVGLKLSMLIPDFGNLGITQKFPNVYVGCGVQFEETSTLTGLCTGMKSVALDSTNSLLMNNLVTYKKHKNPLMHSVTMSS